MRNSTRLITVILAFAAISYSCTSEITGIPYKTVISPECKPEGMGKWNTYAFISDGKTCNDIIKKSRLSDLKGIDAETGDIVTTVTLENQHNIGFTSIMPGEAVESYQILTDDMSSISPRIWSATSVIESDSGTFEQNLKPVTADIEIQIKNAPDALETIEFSIPDGTNEWNIFNNTFKCSGNPVTTTITSDAAGTKSSIFPPLHNKEEWAPDIRIYLGEEMIRPDIKIKEQIESGTTVLLTLDFTDYPEKGIFNLEYSAKDITNPYMEPYVESVTVFTDKAKADADGAHYKVSVMDAEGYWNETETHKALCSNAAKHSRIWNDWNNSRALRDTMSFSIVESSFPAKIRVKKFGESFSSVKIRPTTYGIEAVDLGNNMIEFTIPSKEQSKVSVEFDDDRFHNLFVYVYEPDMNKPSPDDPDVIYFGPGEHNPGEINVTAGQTLYLDYGAKVYANVVTSGNNVTIAGHGILSGEKLQHHGDNLYSWGGFLMQCEGTASNLTVRDITMIDSPNWNMIVRKINGAKIEGVNMISWELNGDGIDLVSSSNVEISNCFLRNYDDCITLKCRFISIPITDVYNIKIHDCLIWNDYARGIVIGPEAGNTKYSGYIHDVEVYDCIFMHHKRSLNDDLRAAFCIGQGGDGSVDLWTGSVVPNKIENIYAHDLIFDNLDMTGRAVAIWQYGTSEDKVHMNNIRFENFNILDGYGNDYAPLTIKTKGSTVSGLKVKNFTVNGTPIGQINNSVSIDYPANVEITIE